MWLLFGGVFSTIRVDRKAALTNDLHWSQTLSDPWGVSGTIAVAGRPYE